MQNYKVLSTGSDLFRKSRTEPVIKNGRQTAVKEIETVFQIGKASDGRDEFVYEFRFEPGSVMPGDIISANESTREPGMLEDIFVEVPAPGSRTVERILPLPKSPADSIDVLKLAVESGQDLTGADLRDLCSRFLALEKKFSHAHE